MESFDKCVSNDEGEIVTFQVNKYSLIKYFLFTDWRV